ncbi:N-lysine methyltransferase SMYD2 [Hyphodiscus hymeniophilus]|uniref:N-lysine methyltransferase SMYD2 n=1 Tax=Hyphodiscus hymeniophilus TaxID=353542 RepID=A0A9P6VEI5_9HELO|nr:N-lysine methyltransferase SMYD2 [Hyphodiscus hymeniophilus]
MRLSLNATVFLISVAQAGQHPITFDFTSNFCSINEKENLLALAQLNDGLNFQRCSLKPAIPANLWTEGVKCIPNITETYCIYTNENFANGRGISFFTTPSIADGIASLPAFTQKDLYGNVNNFANPPWEIKQVPGRGRGVFATRTLHRGDPIMAVTPIGIYHSDAFPHDFPLNYIYLHTAFIQLPKPTQNLFLSTMVYADGDPIMERINTNAFSGEFEGASHFLLYPETAKMNHACRPSAMYYYDPKTLIHATQASRTIHPGEEITIPYINILQPREDRQHFLSTSWGFTCTCSLCSSSATHTHASDARIRRIVHLQNALADWSGESIGTPGTAEKLIDLYEEEGIHAAKGTGHMFAALAYNAVGDTAMAKEHAEGALVAGLVNNGHANGEAADENEMKSLVDWPEGHWSFMARRR